MQGIDSKLKLLKPVLGTQKCMKLRMMYHFEDDFRQKREIENRIDLLISKLVKTQIDDQIILPPPNKEACKGDINIGTVEYLDRKICSFDLKLKDLNRHVGIFGSTGSGKTTQAKHILSQLHKKDVPFMIIDWETSYRNLTKKQYPDLEVFTVGKDIHPLHLNILEVPPGITKDEYAKSLISLIAEDYLSGAGSDTMFLNYIQTAYLENEKPCFDDLKEIILREIKKDMKGTGRLAGRSGLWKETVQRIVNFLSIGASGNVLNSRTSYPLHKLFEKNVVLEFGGIQSPRDRKFFIHCIINWMFLYLQHHGIESEKLKNCIIMEEFHNISMRGNEDNLVSLMFRQIRKYGVSLIAIDQTPSEIPNAIYANMNTKISFTLGTAKDIAAISKAMNMNPRHANYLGMLKTGQAIINTRQRYPDPFLLQIPFIKEDERVWDSELQSLMLKFSGELSRFQTSQGLDDAFKTNQTNQDAYTSPPLAPLEKVMLTNIVERPIDSMNDRTKSLGLHPSETVRLQESLTDKGYITTIYIDRKKMIQLTDTGKDACKVANIIVPKRKTRGGIEHYYWIKETRQLLKNIKFQPVLEHLDIDIADPTQKLAIEVETGKSSIIKNLLKLQNSRFTRRFMLATNKAAEFKIKQRALDFPEITAMHVKDFLKLSKSQILNPKSITSHSTQPKEVVAST